MPTVDFLPFAVGGAANVEAQAAYAAETALLANGFVSGVAPSAKFNKALRQSSIMSAVLAQFIADLSGQNVIDDGTITTILANFKSSINPGSSLSGSGYQRLPGGLIFQWKQQLVTTTNAAYSYPIAFPTGMLAIFPGNANSNTTIPVATNNSQSQFNAYANSAGSYYFLAIGY